jgi:hypothetical protein
MSKDRADALVGAYRDFVASRLEAIEQKLDQLIMLFGAFDRREAQARAVQDAAAKAARNERS